MNKKVLSFLAGLLLIPALLFAQSAPTGLAASAVGANVPKNPGIYTVRQAGCTVTGGNVNTCVGPTLTLPGPFSDGNFSVACGCVGALTALPIAVGVVTAAPTISAGASVSMQVQIISGALSAVTAACSVMSCTFFHD